MLCNSVKPREFKPNFTLTEFHEHLFSSADLKINILSFLRPRGIHRKFLAFFWSDALQMSLASWRDLWIFFRSSFENYWRDRRNSKLFIVSIYRLSDNFFWRISMFIKIFNWVAETMLGRYKTYSWKDSWRELRGIWWNLGD